MDFSSRIADVFNLLQMLIVNEMYEYYGTNSIDQLQSSLDLTRRLMNILLSAAARYAKF